MHPIKLEAKLATFSEHWQPRTVAQFNGNDVMVVKAKGEFVWHKHDDTDDFFLVLEGRLTIEMRDGSVSLGPGRAVRGAERSRAPAGRGGGSPPSAHRAARHAEHGRSRHGGAEEGAVSFYPLPQPYLVLQYPVPRPTSNHP